MKSLFLSITVLLLSCGAVKAQTFKTSDSTNIRHTETVGKAYKVYAIIKKINTEEHTITLKHERLKGYMSAATTTFPVSKPEFLNNLKEGSKGIFTIFVFKGKPMVTKIAAFPIKHRKKI